MNRLHARPGIARMAWHRLQNGKAPIIGAQHSGPAQLARHKLTRHGTARRGAAQQGDAGSGRRKGKRACLNIAQLTPVACATIPYPNHQGSLTQRASWHSTARSKRARMREDLKEGTARLAQHGWHGIYVCVGLAWHGLARDHTAIDPPFSAICTLERQ